MREKSILPSNTERFEAALLGLASSLEADRFVESDLRTHMSSDGRYFFVSTFLSTVEYDDLTTEADKVLASIDAQGFAEVWRRLEYDQGEHRDLFAYPARELVYMPSDFDEDPNEERFRKLTFFYERPGTERAMYGLFEEWKALSARHDVDRPFVVYRGGDDTAETFFILESYGEDQEDERRWMNDLRSTLGEEGDVLWDRLSELTWKSDEVHAYYRPDLSYEPGRSEPPA